MAKALSHLGKKVSIVCDENNRPIVEKALQWSKLSSNLYVFPTGEDGWDLSEKIIDDEKIDHVMSIERIGPAIDHHYYSMMGRDLTEYVGKTEHLLLAAQKRGIKTTAIGDGGNELGMGKVYDRIVKHVKFGDKIACSVSADYVIIAGVSNWGGLAISSVLYLLSGQSNPLNFIYDLYEESQLLDFIVEAGSIDGTTGKQEASVDGFLYTDLHQGVLKEFHLIIKDDMQ